MLAAAQRGWSTLLLVLAVVLAGDPAATTSRRQATPRTPSPHADVARSEPVRAPPPTPLRPHRSARTEGDRHGRRRNLDVPWGLGFLPDGTAVLTERDSATIKTRSADGAVAEAGVVDGVVPAGEGGLLGLAVSPTSAATQRCSCTTPLSTTTGSRPDHPRRRVSRAAGHPLGTPQELDAQRRGRPFGPDGYLYVAPETPRTALAQDPGYLGGKTPPDPPDGSPAPGNPFPAAPLVYSLGHRNVQGLAFDAGGRLWASEFGQNRWDELNLITAGGNYGWPTVEGISDQAGFISPQRVWPTSEASPSGIAIVGGSVWMAGLRGERLWQIPLTGDGTGEPLAHPSTKSTGGCAPWWRLRTAASG